MAEHLAGVTVSHQKAFEVLYGRTNILSLWGIKRPSEVVRAGVNTSGLSMSSLPQKARIQVKTFVYWNRPNCALIRLGIHLYRVTTSLEGWSQLGVSVRQSGRRWKIQGRLSVGMSQRSFSLEALGQRIPMVLEITGLDVLNRIKVMLHLRRSRWIGLRSAPAHDRRHNHLQEELPQIITGQIFIVIVGPGVMLSVPRHEAKLQRVRLGSGV